MYLQQPVKTQLVWYRMYECLCFYHSFNLTKNPNIISAPTFGANTLRSLVGMEVGKVFSLGGMYGMYDNTLRHAFKIIVKKCLEWGPLSTQKILGMPHQLCTYMNEQQRSKSQNSSYDGMHVSTYMSIMSLHQMMGYTSLDDLVR